MEKELEQSTEKKILPTIQKLAQEIHDAKQNEYVKNINIVSIFKFLLAGGIFTTAVVGGYFSYLNKTDFGVIVMVSFFVSMGIIMSCNVEEKCIKTEKKLKILYEKSKFIENKQHKNKINRFFDMIEVVPGSEASIEKETTYFKFNKAIENKDYLSAIQILGTYFNGSEPDDMTEDNYQEEIITPEYVIFKKLL